MQNEVKCYLCNTYQCKSLQMNQNPRNLQHLIYQVSKIPISIIQAEVLVNLLAYRRTEIEDVMQNVFKFDDKQTDLFNNLFHQLVNGRYKATVKTDEYPEIVLESGNFEYKQHLQAVMTQQTQQDLLQRAMMCGPVKSMVFSQKEFVVQFTDFISLKLYEYLSNHPQIIQEPSEEAQDEDPTPQDIKYIHVSFGKEAKITISQLKQKLLGFNVQKSQILMHSKFPKAIIKFNGEEEAKKFKKLCTASEFEDKLYISKSLDEDAIHHDQHIQFDQYK